MKNGKIWAAAFFCLLILNVGGFFYLKNKSILLDVASLKTENIELREEYLKNAKQLKYILETVLDNSEELKNYMPEYESSSNIEFEDALRKKVVKLDLQIEQIEKKVGSH